MTWSSQGRTFALYDCQTFKLLRLSKTGFLVNLLHVKKLDVTSPGFDSPLQSRKARLILAGGVHETTDLTPAQLIPVSILHPSFFVIKYRVTNFKLYYFSIGPLGVEHICIL